MSVSSTLFDSLIDSCLGVLSSWFVSHVSDLEDLRPTDSFVTVFLQVIAMSSVVSSALIIPFLIMAAFSSTATSWLAPKWGGGYALKALFVIPLAILAGGMVSSRIWLIPARQD